MAPPEKSAESDNGASAKGEGDADRRGPPEWLDAAFIQKAFLRAGEENVHVERIEISYAVPLGDNFCSSIFRVAVHMRGEIAARSVIVKCPPEGETFAKMIDAALFFQKEIHVLSTVLECIHAMFHERRKEFPTLTARCLYSGDKPQRFLVLQDLKKENFYLGDRCNGLTLDQATLALKALGRFHAATHVLWKNLPEVFEIMSNPFEKDGIMGTEDRFNKSIDIISEAISTWSVMYAKKLLNLKTRTIKKVRVANSTRPDKFNVLVHGDFWVNNMMFKNNDEGKAIDIRLLDFQIGRVTNPAIDLILFRYTSLPSEVLSNWDELLNDYVESLAETLDVLGEKPVTLAEIQECMEEAREFCFLAALVWLPRVRMVTGKFDVEKAVNEGEAAQNHLYYTPEFTHWMKQFLPEFDERGMLD